MIRCPHCQAELPDVGDAYCSECRDELPVAGVNEGAAPAERPMTPNEAGWVIVAVLQGFLTLLFIGSVSAWIVLSLVEQLQSK